MYENVFKVTDPQNILFPYFSLCVIHSQINHKKISTLLIMSHLQNKKRTRTLSEIEKSLTIPQNKKQKQSMILLLDDGTLITQPTKQNPNTSSPSSECDSPINKILEFVNKHDAVRQNTPKWHELMKTTIGGSEVATLVGMNTYQSRKALLEGKKEASRTFVRVIPCLWGKLFEEVIRIYIEVLFDNRIYGEEICIVDGQFRYSPDGLGVVSRNIDGIASEKIVLFEFKCPYTRRPDGTIPKHYKPQLWAGLAATEGLTDYGIYVDSVFRRCRSSQLNSGPDYDKDYHSKDYQQYQKPVAWGEMNIYSKVRSKDGKCIDYGEADGETFNKMLKAVDDGKLTTSLLYLEFAGSLLDLLCAQGFHDMHLVGSIPFKIMKVHCERVERIPNFKSRLMPLIKAFFDDVNKNNA